MSRENEVGTMILDAAFYVHDVLGIGLMESVYESALARVLAVRGLRVRRQAPIDVVFLGEPLGLGFKADLIVEDLVLVELKAVSRLTEAHFRQALTYLKLSRLKLAYLINFDVPRLQNGGIKRLVNGLERGLEPAR
jgi:GxxExxY protein